MNAAHVSERLAAVALGCVACTMILVPVAEAAARRESPVVRDASDFRPLER